MTSYAHRTPTNRFLFQLASLYIIMWPSPPRPSRPSAASVRARVSLSRLVVIVVAISSVDIASTYVAKSTRERKRTNELSREVYGSRRREMNNSSSGYEIKADYDVRGRQIDSTATPEIIFEFRANGLREMRSVVEISSSGARHRDNGDESSGEVLSYNEEARRLIELNSCCRRVSPSSRK